MVGRVFEKTVWFVSVAVVRYRFLTRLTILSTSNVAAASAWWSTASDLDFSILEARGKNLQRGHCGRLNRHILSILSAHLDQLPT